MINCPVPLNPPGIPGMPYSHKGPNACNEYLKKKNEVVSQVPSSG